MYLIAKNPTETNDTKYLNNDLKKDLNNDLTKDLKDLKERSDSDKKQPPIIVEREDTLGEKMIQVFISVGFLVIIIFGIYRSINMKRTVIIKEYDSDDDENDNTIVMEKKYPRRRIMIRESSPDRTVIIRKKSPRRRIKLL